MTRGVHSRPTQEGDEPADNGGWFAPPIHQTTSYILENRRASLAGGIDASATNAAVVTTGWTTT